MAARKKAEVGQRYRLVGIGGVPSTLWEVTRVFTPWRGGFEHASIKRVAAVPETMMLASSVIANKNRFIPEG